MKKCPVCKMEYLPKAKTCIRCGLNLDWIKWQKYSVLIVCVGAFLGLMIPVYLGFESTAIGYGILITFFGIGITPWLYYDIKIKRWGIRKNTP